MSWTQRRWTLVSALLAAPAALLALTIGALAQIATTTVTDTVYRADGTRAGGTVIVSWPAFTTASGQAVTAGSTSAVIGANGVLSIALTPNAGALPIGTYYTAVYHLDDGSVTREYWVVPVSASPVKISAIRSSVLPTSVAMQTVTKSYVDTAIAAAVSGHPLDTTNPYVLKAGDTMTGPLILSGDPTAQAQAATKNYVDVTTAGLAAGLGQKVATFPASTQTVAQPTGTELQVNRLNGVEYASQYQGTFGGDGITNAASSADCASGCEIKVEQTYNSGEHYTPTQLKDGTHIEDSRRGGRRDTYVNPENVVIPGTETGQAISVTATRDAATIHQLTGSQTPASIGLSIDHRAFAGGSNQYVQGIGAIPYFKAGYSALTVNGVYNTQGQHVLAPHEIDCYGVGDCLIGAQFLYSSGGARDNADEGAHPFDLQIREDWHVFTGTCASGCTTGSTSLMINATSSGGTQGDGRFLINTTPAKVISAGKLIGAQGGGPDPGAVFSGTSFPVSTFFRIAQGISSQADNIAPGTVTVAIATSGLPSGFAANTVAAPASSGVACVADPPAETNYMDNFETANYTVVDSTHLQLTLNKAHFPHATVAIGGLCGYGVEQTVDTAGAIRQVFPVIGSYSPTALYYAGAASSNVGVFGQTSAYLNASLAITSAVRSGNVVTVTTAGNVGVDLNGLTITIAGVTDSSYNGNFLVTTTSGNTFTYAENGPDSTSTGGTLSYLTGGYHLYPMAEVLSVFNAATKAVDGQMTLAPNNIAWAPGDTVEQPHYHQQKVGPDVEFISQAMPRPDTFQVAGIEYQDNNGAGLTGWSVRNASPLSNYFGNGGTHLVPDAAYVAQGAWKRTMSLDAGEQSVFTIHCNLHSCNRWNSSYNLLELDSSAGTDTLTYSPGGSALYLGLRGAVYSFTPQGFSASTINTGTINAGIINGPVAASQLPVFHASGASHAQGAVPDPGATAGTTRFLREDGTWATPAGGTASSSSAGSILISGATADYDFLQGSGTVATDKSGNNNNGTLGSGTSWTQQGLSIPAGDYVSLPSALNGSKTFIAAVYITPTQTSYSSSGVPVVVTSSLGSSGLNLTLLYVNSAGIDLNTFAPGVWNNGAKTVAMSRLSGFHVLAWTLGTSGSTADHVYIDGVEPNSYTMQSSSAGAQASGNLFLGEGGTWGGGVDETFYRFRTYNTELAASDIFAISAAFRSEVAARGVTVDPTPVPLGVPRLHAIGDSITAGAGSTPWPSLLSGSLPTFEILNWGIGDFGIAEALTAEPNRAARSCKTMSGVPSVAIVFMGTNDFHHGNQAVASVWNDIAAEASLLKRAGCAVFIGTMLSRTGSVGIGTYDSAKNALDAVILQQWKTTGADGVIDFAADPVLGADGANSNTTYFLQDATHPTQTGQNHLAIAASNALNYFYGYSLANPNVVTANTYTLASSDGAITAAPTANAAYTMPDCTGPSGATYTISNPQSAYTVTIQGQANQPINGLVTPIAIPANSTVTLRDVPNPKNVSGCHWVM